jgi:hypothetical protein
MKSSENINEIAKALSAFLGEVPAIPHNKEVKKKLKDGSVMTYTYADLDIIRETCKKPMAKFGLSAIQDVVTITNEGGVWRHIETTAIHESGQWIKTECPLLEPADYGYVPMQTFGGLVTYGKRYGFCLTFGLTSDADLDANEDGDVKNKVKPPVVKNTILTSTKDPVLKPMPNSATGLMKISVNDSVRIVATAKACGWTDDQLNEYVGTIMKKNMLRDLNNNEMMSLVKVIKSGNYEQAIAQA